MVQSTSEATRALIEEAFARYEQGDPEPLFERVADEVRWTVMGTHPLAGEYASKREFLEATYSRIAGALEGPIRCTVTRILVDGEWAVVEWRGQATSVTGEPFNNFYCWVMRVVDGQITEVTAYVDTALVVELFDATGA